MKIKLKLSEVYAGFIALKELANYKYPPSIAWRIKKNLQALERDFTEFQKTCYELAKEKEYGTDYGNMRYKVDDKNLDKFKEDTKALEMEEVEVEISQLTLENILEITPNNLIALEWMFIPPADPVPGAEKPSKSRKAR